MNTDQILKLYELKTELDKNDLLSVMLSLSVKDLDDLLAKAKVIAGQAAISRTQAAPPVCPPEADRR